jgi:phytoene dehydrogenase-like protein
MKAGGWVLVIGMVGILAASVFTGLAMRDRFRDLEASIPALKMEWDERWEARWKALVEYEERLHGDIDAWATEMESRAHSQTSQGERLLGALRRLEQRLVPPDERGFFEQQAAQDSR